MSEDSVSSYWQLTHASSELSGIKMSQKGKLLSVIGDEVRQQTQNLQTLIKKSIPKDTCVGFLLGGIGEINKSRQTNFMVVEKTTTVGEIEKCFSEFTKREEIAIILITQIVADTIRAKLEAHTSTSMKPVVIEIPSKDHPYDENKDAIMRRAKVNPFFRLSEENAEPNLLKFGDS